MTTATRRNRTAAALLTAALVLTAGTMSPTAAAGRRKRVTVTGTYVGTGAAGGRGVQILGVGDAFLGGHMFDPPGTFRHVRVEVDDEVAPEVAFVVSQDPDEDGFLDSHSPGCSNASAPIEVVPHEIVGIFVQAGPCEDGTPAFSTRGTITVTFLP